MRRRSAPGSIHSRNDTGPSSGEAPGHEGRLLSGPLSLRDGPFISGGMILHPKPNDRAPRRIAGSLALACLLMSTAAAAAAEVDPEDVQPGLIATYRTPGEPG